MPIAKRLFELQQIYLYGCIQLQRMRGTGPVSMETAKNQGAFFNLNSRRPSIDYDVRFFSTQNHIAKKLNAVMLFVRPSSTNML